jgi:DNA-binding transcriptional MerR regulator
MSYDASMDQATLTIGELAAATGLSRRGVRFYVQQGLLPAPDGRGRGASYEPSHVKRVQQILELQSAGHSLDAIRRLLAGGVQAGPTFEAPIRPPHRSSTGNGQGRRPRPALASQLWTRLPLADGVEIHLDTSRQNPTVEQLLAIRQAVQEILRED